MFRKIFAVILSLLLVPMVFAQSGLFLETNQNGLTQIWTSGGAVTSGGLVTVNSVGQVVNATTTATSGVIGVALNGATGAGIPIRVSVVGAPAIAVDGACTAGNLVYISTATSGQAHCAAGYQGGQLVGTSQQTISTAGNVAVTLLLQNSGVVPAAYVTAQYTNATTTLSNIPGLSFTLNPSTNYAISCHLIFQGSATTAGLAVQWTAPASLTKFTISMVQALTSGGSSTYGENAADGTSSVLVGGFTLVTTASDLGMDLYTGIITGTTGGTLQLQGKAQGAGTATVQAGSFCNIQ